MKNITNRKLLEYNFRKKFDDISETEIMEIKKISISGDESNNYSLDLTDIDIFDNLQEIVISDAMITINDFEILKNIPMIQFKRCAFQNENDLAALSNATILEFNNCYITNYDYLSKLVGVETLSILKPETEDVIDCKLLTPLINLKQLSLNFCNICNFSGLSSCLKLKRLQLIGTDLPDNYYDIIMSIPDLNELFVDSEYVKDYGTVLVHTNILENVFSVPKGSIR